MLPLVMTESRVFGSWYQLIHAVKWPLSTCDTAFPPIKSLSVSMHSMCECFTEVFMISSCSSLKQMKETIRPFRTPSTTGWTDPVSWCSKMGMCQNLDWVVDPSDQNLLLKLLQIQQTEALLEHVSKNHPNILPKLLPPPGWRKAAALWPPSPHGVRLVLRSPPALWCWALPKLNGLRGRQRRRKSSLSHRRRTLWLRRRSWRRAGWSNMSSPAAQRRLQYPLLFHTKRQMAGGPRSSRACLKWPDLMEEMRRTPAKPKQPVGREQWETLQLPLEILIMSANRALLAFCPRTKAVSLGK